MKVTSCFSGILFLSMFFLISCKTTTSDLSSEKASELGFGENFYFGVATAPAHVEDELDDIWLEFAESEPSGVKAWRNAGFPELRLKFYSEYQTEVDLAHELGSEVFRMGLDWGRLVPEKPVDTCPEASSPCLDFELEEEAVLRYREIIDYIRSKNISVMLTLYHHSMPKWLQSLTEDRSGKSNKGGWTNPLAIDYFVAFSEKVASIFKDQVDIWVIFNEPAIFASLAYTAGIWPPANGVNYFSIVDAGFFKGDFIRAVNHMIKAHNLSYQRIKAIDTLETKDPFTSSAAQVGIAHNVGYYTSNDVLSAALQKVFKDNLNYRFIDGVIDNLDFLGLNYYGQEFLSLRAGLALQEQEEYSESGRGINPNGLYELLVEFNERYLKARPNITIVITENGISDSSDILRPAYLLEHLAAIKAAVDAGVNVGGYIFWTLSDNWEWADGYCPKFGLVSVDRSSKALARGKRPSFELYSRIIKTRAVSQSQRRAAWNLVQENIGKPRPFCRDANGLESLDEPSLREISSKDWRFKL